MSTKDLYVIVKHAMNGVWENYYTEDPKLGVPFGASCHESYSAKEASIRPHYDSLFYAQLDCERINSFNPCGYYDVCPVRIVAEMRII